MSQQKFVDKVLEEHKVAVFSKTYCPFCKMAKDALNSTGVKYHVVELDEIDNGDAIQDIMGKMTGGRSVPRVFIAGKFIGGGSETKAFHESGKLTQMLKDANAL